MARLSKAIEMPPLGPQSLFPVHRISCLMGRTSDASQGDITVKST